MGDTCICVSAEAHTYTMVTTSFDRCKEKMMDKENKYKYPWIPREYYKPVMLACKMIRENGFFNKAIQTAANYYHVDQKELEQHVRKRQGAGQKGKHREYKYYVCLCFEPDWYNDSDCGFYYMFPHDKDLKKRFYVSDIVKASNINNAEKKASHTLGKKYYDYYFAKDCYVSDIVLETYSFDKKKQAEEFIASFSITDETVNKHVSTIEKKIYGCI